MKDFFFICETTQSCFCDFIATLYSTLSRLEGNSHTRSTSCNISAPVTFQWETSLIRRRLSMMLSDADNNNQSLSPSSPRHPTMAAGVPGVLGERAPEPAAAGCSSLSVCATTRRHGTMDATARGREPSIGPATSLHVQHQVRVAACSCDKKILCLTSCLYIILTLF